MPMWCDWLCKALAHRAWVRIRALPAGPGNQAEEPWARVAPPPAWPTLERPQLHGGCQGHAFAPNLQGTASRPGAPGQVPAVAAERYQVLGDRKEAARPPRPLREGKGAPGQPRQSHRWGRAGCALPTGPRGWTEDLLEYQTPGLRSTWAAEDGVPASLGLPAHLTPEGMGARGEGPPSVRRNQAPRQASGPRRSVWGGNQGPGQMGLE